MTRDHSQDDDHSPAALDARLGEGDASDEQARDFAFLRERLPEQLDDGRDLDPLWDRVRGVLDAGDAVARDTATATAPFGRRAPTRRAFLRYGMAASVLLAAGIGGSVYLSRGAAADVVTETLNDYLTFRASGKALHVSGPVPSEIESWLEERIDFDLSFADTSSEFRLAGGRLCSFLGRRLAALHFVDGTHAGYRDASLYVMREDGLDLPSTERRAIAGRETVVTRDRGIGVVIWRSRGLLHLAVSPMAEDALIAFSSSV